MIIAVDFDGTLCEHRFPEIGAQKEIHLTIAEFIRHEKQGGSTIILWTCREDLPERKYLSEALQWCRMNNIPIDYANEYPMPDFKGFASRKVCADLYIDDKAINANYFQSQIT